MLTSPCLLSVSERVSPFKTFFNIRQEIYDSLLKFRFWYNSYNFISAVYISELESMASSPVCKHLFLLKDFNEIDSLKYAIEKSTCGGNPKLFILVLTPHVLVFFCLAGVILS